LALSVAVLGAGTMGNGIAQVFAQAGFTVRLVDVAQPMLDRARHTIEKSLARQNSQNLTYLISAISACSAVIVCEQTK
jgi:3-hydroxybutyryl-CoA dehydrogenase